MNANTRCPACDGRGQTRRACRPVACPACNGTGERTTTDETMNDIINSAVEKYNPSHIIAMFSGGHDSLVATHIAMQHPRFSFAAHMNTGIGIEQTREFVRNTCRLWGIELREYRAANYVRADGQPDPQVYADMVLEYGFPGPPQHRKMYNRLKERPLRAMLRDLNTKRGERVLLVTGVRQQESVRRMAHVTPIQEWEAKVWVAPVWDWSKRDVNAYISERGLGRNLVADILHMSGECLCGAFAHPGELDEIRTWFPEAAAEIERIQEQVMRDFPWGWEDGPPDWWMLHQRGQNFLPGMGPEMLCVGCDARRSGTGERQEQPVSGRRDLPPIDRETALRIIRKVAGL